MLICSHMYRFTVYSSQLCFCCLVDFFFLHLNCHLTFHCLGVELLCLIFLSKYSNGLEICWVQVQVFSSMQKFKPNGNQQYYFWLKNDAILYFSDPQTFIIIFRLVCPSQFHSIELRSVYPQLNNNNNNVFDRYTLNSALVGDTHFPLSPEQ